MGVAVIPAFYVHLSRTAEPRVGHMAFIGAGIARSHVAAQPMCGHRQFIGTAAPRVVDNQAEAIRLRDAERARRALWAECERRPIAFDLGEG